MIKAILLDLDNTLLYNPDVAFARGFLAHFEAYFEARLGLGGAGDGFRLAIQGLSHRRDVVMQRNWDVMIDILSDHLGCDEAVGRDIVHDFYGDAYLDLEGLVEPIEGNRALIDYLYDSGYAIVIATNPIYSHKATLTRMGWAGLPTDESLYAFITSAESVHFSKDNPAYYAEIVARVGVEPDEALMVGDRIGHDIVPAMEAGLYTYHLRAEGDEGQGEGGTLGRFGRLIRQGDWLGGLAARILNRGSIVPEYLGNLGAMYGLLGDVKDNYWHQRPQQDEWSIVQILCHLWQSERTHERVRLARIVAEDNPFIVAPTPPGPDLVVCDEDGWRVARSFEAERRATIAFLSGLAEDDWLRPARHSVFGHTHLLEMAHFTAQHDRLHLNQLCQTIGHCR